MSIDANTNDVELIYSQCSRLRNYIVIKSKDILSILTQYEPFPTAVDEIQRSLNALENIELEEEFLKAGKVESIASFLPLNLPLYSLLLFGFIPSFMARRVYIRPPVLMRKTFRELFGLLQPRIPNQIKYFENSRNNFIKSYALLSSVIIFTGRYLNALEILEKISGDSLFIYNGAGVNPIIVTVNSNLELAAEKTIEARLYNSGQDCAGPDIIFVKKECLDDFVSILTGKLRNIMMGNFNNTEVRVGPLLDLSTLSTSIDFLKQHKEDIIFGGKFNAQDRIITPTVVLHTISDFPRNVEFFSPIFNLVSYTQYSEVASYLQSEDHLQNAMYVSLFGDLFLEIENETKNKFTLLKNKNVLDVEQGNLPFGGYGKKSSFIWRDKQIVAKPILISKEIGDFLASSR